MPVAVAAATGCLFRAVRCLSGRGVVEVARDPLHSQRRLDYHKRSNVESTFGAIKAKFGSSVRAKTDAGQMNEVLAKVLCHNLCVLIRAMLQLGIEA